MWLLLVALMAACDLRPSATPTSTAVLLSTPAAAQSPTSALALTATPSATPAPTPWPENVNPLTGETVSDPALLALRPLAIKIVNEPPCARPQFGLNSAAVVFEYYVEAWVTRFTAVFYGREAEKVGPVRSARLIDVELPAIFDAVLVTTGWSGGVGERLLNSDLADRIIATELQADCPPLCRVPIESVPCQKLEYTMFTATRELHTTAAARGLEGRPELSGWAFAARTPAGESATTVGVAYVNAPALWTYDQASGLYLRSQSGRKQVDALTSLRLTAANVVVLFANHLYTDIVESPSWYSLEIQFWGQGPALVYRDGVALRGLWLRPQRNGLFGLVNQAGAPLALKPGRTWFEFVPLDSGLTVESGIWAIAPTVLPQQTPPLS